jgi:hypothetical protein
LLSQIDVFTLIYWLSKGRLVKGFKNYLDLSWFWKFEYQGREGSTRHSWQGVQWSRRRDKVVFRSGGGASFTAWLQQKQLK